MRPLPNTPQFYAWEEINHILKTIELNQKEAHSRVQDIQLGQTRLIITSPNGTRFAIEVDNGGVLSATPL